MGRVVLVTGAARQLGGYFARRIQEDPNVDRTVGVDVLPPVRDLGRAEFVKADIRQHAFSAVLDGYGVDTVVHMDVHGTRPGVVGNGLGAGRASAKESNVLGTLQLLGACQRAASVRRLVIKSSTGVYGSAPRDPAVFDVGTPARALPRGGFAKDVVEVEEYARGFARRRLDVSVTVLRFAHILGSCGDSALGAYFALPVLPAVVGFDPRLQFVHEDDAVEALRLASLGGGGGSSGVETFNVAGAGVLLLSQCARRLGRPTVPLLLPAVRWLGGALRTVGATDFSAEQLRLLTHGRVVRTARTREVLGFEPRYSTEETLEAYARDASAGPLSPKTLARGVDGLASLLNRRRGGAESTDEEVNRHG